MAKVVVIVFVCLFWILGCGKEEPNIEITNPADGALVNGLVEITVEASNNTEIVEFYIDDSLAFTSTSYPNIYLWNTFPLAESSWHDIYAQAYNEEGIGGNVDTISVIVFNDSTIFADDFETYSAGEYPSASGWFEIWAGTDSGSTYIASDIAYSGNKSFKLNGSAPWVRTDGVDLQLTEVHRLTYEFAVMIPASSGTGAILGFFVLLNPSTGTVYNGVLFDFEDGLVYVRGIAEASTGYAWSPDIWYSVRVMLNYDSLSMNVWLNNDQIASNVAAASIGTSNTFAIATEYGGGGVVYYDDILIYENSD